MSDERDWLVRLEYYVTLGRNKTVETREYARDALTAAAQAAAREGNHRDLQRATSVEIPK